MISKRNIKSFYYKLFKQTWIKANSKSRGDKTIDIKIPFFDLRKNHKSSIFCSLDRSVNKRWMQKETFELFQINKDNQDKDNQVEYQIQDANNEKAQKLHRNNVKFRTLKIENKRWFPNETKIRKQIQSSESSNRSSIQKVKTVSFQNQNQKVKEKIVQPKECCQNDQNNSEENSMLERYVGIIQTTNLSSQSDDSFIQVRCNQNKVPQNICVDSKSSKKSIFSIECQIASRFSANKKPNMYQLPISSYQFKNSDKKSVPQRRNLMFQLYNSGAGSSDKHEKFPWNNYIFSDQMKLPNMINYNGLQKQRGPMNLLKRVEKQRSKEQEYQALRRQVFKQMTEKKHGQNQKANDQI